MIEDQEENEEGNNEIDDDNNNDDNNSNENENSNENKEEKVEELESENKNIINNSDTKKNNISNKEDMEKLLDLFNKKIELYAVYISETQFQQSISDIIFKTEKNLGDFNKNHEKLEELLSQIDKNKNIKSEALLFNKDKVIYKVMWDISCINFL